jgi:caa(3)-type oxidase subunit IV
VRALAILLALTLASFIFSFFVHLGRASTLVALVIAAVKASIVALAFMEVREASLPSRVIALVTIAFIALLCAGTATDVLLRK